MLKAQTSQSSTYRNDKYSLFAMRRPQRASKGKTKALNSLQAISLDGGSQI
jgi:hypothetical protein